MANGICPACGAAALEAWRSAPAAEAGLGPVALQRCSRCGTAVTASPAPADTDLHETGAYQAGVPAAVARGSPVLRAFDRQRLRLLRGPCLPAPRCSTLARAADGSSPLRGPPGITRRASSPLPGGSTAPWRPMASRCCARGSRTRRSRRPRRTPSASGTSSSTSTTPAARWTSVARWLRPGGALLVGVPNLASLAGACRRGALVSPRPPAASHALHPGRPAERCCARTGSTSSPSTTCWPSTTRSACGSRSSAG